jgi:hypothetical protein
VRVGRFDLPEPTRTQAPPGSLLAQEASSVHGDVVRGGRRRHVGRPGRQDRAADRLDDAQTDEGVTMDDDGHLYVVNEQGGGDASRPQLWVYAPSTAPDQPPTGVTLLGFKQPIAATDPLRTGTYTSTLTFTLSTTSP